MTSIVDGGGILVTPNMGANNVTFTGSSGGSLEGTRNAANRGFVTWQNNTRGLLILNCQLSDSTAPDQFVQAGSGTVQYFGGTSGAANNYTGQTYLDGGVSEIYADSGFGTPSSGAQVNLNGGTVLAGATLILDNAGANKRAVILGNNGGGLAAVSGFALTVDGVVSGLTGPLIIGIPSSSANGNVAGQVPGTGTGTANTTPVNATGTVALAGANTYTGGTVLYNGVLNFIPGALGMGGVTFNGGTLQWGGSNTRVHLDTVLTIGVKRFLTGRK
jgi:autotransporter-associated beta strand protein